MRRLADTLSVAPGTLYTYVSNRTSLLTLVLDTVVEYDGLPHELPGTWREKLESWAWTDFNDFCARPWVLDLRATVREVGPNMITWFDSALRVFDGLDVSDEVRMHMVDTVDAYVVGSAFSYMETVAAIGHEPAEDMTRAVGAALQAAPVLQRALENSSRVFDAERFGFGLRCLLDGFAAELDTPSS